MAFVDPTAHPFTRELCAELTGELEPLRQAAAAMRFIEWPEPIYSGQWDVSSFKYRHRLFSDEFGAVDPGQFAAIQRPEIQTFGFSLLGAGAEIRWHQGNAGDIWRLHLGLDCPDGDCALQVMGEIRHWCNGEFLMFNDQDAHRAWNRTDRDRLILLVDISKAALAL